MKQKDIPAVRSSILEGQGGRCPICGREPKVPCLDHDHTTGAVRGVLCSTCNAMEGRIKNAARRVLGSGNEAKILLALIEYWKAHGATPSGLIHPLHKKRRPRKRKTAKSKFVKALKTAGFM